MTWKTFRFVAVFASLALAACADLTEDGRYSELSFYGRGKFHYDAGQYGLAVKHFRSAVDREPGSVEALNGLAASYDRLGRYDLATKYYGRALGADPESTQTLNNIGYSYLLQKRFDLAVAYLRDAHSRDRNDPVIQANRMVAEVAYREADLKRSAEMARAEPIAGRRRPAELVEARPNLRITVAAAPSARPAPPPRGQVKSWVERTAPTIQTLVTRPQTALLGMVEQAGVSPQLAAYRPQRPAAAPDPLPGPLATPLVLDDRPSAALDGSILPEVTVARLDPVELIGPVEEAKQPRPGRQLRPLIEVSNGTGRLSMAERMRRYLESEGLVIRRLTNADTFTRQETTIFYRAGWKAYAEDLARLLPAAIDLERRVGQVSDIRLELGGDLLNFDRGLYYTVGRPSGAHSG